jgi:hypothetical protein
VAYLPPKIELGQIINPILLYNLRLKKAIGESKFLKHLTKIFDTLMYDL